MMLEDDMMYPSEICERVDIGVKRIEKICAEPRRLSFIETITFFNISLGDVR